jgi:hypothetical protein
MWFLVTNVNGAIGQAAICDQAIGKIKAGKRKTSVVIKQNFQGNVV